ncbi:MAG TPA: hypothetical protein VJ785_06795 [Anaerolineales bacterium]|nr:hypothetical protein [Anaerolineales bacterium]
MRACPAWRGSGGTALIDDNIRFNRWFKEARTDPAPISLLDTTEAALETTLEQVKA